MIEKESIKSVKKLANLLLIFSITSLVLISFLPWITTDIEESGTGTKYLNFQMMKDSVNSEIYDLTSSLSLTAYLLWVVIAISLISIFGTILCLTKKYQILANIFILSGFITLILFVLILINNFAFLNDVENTNNVSIAHLANPFAFAHIFILFNIISTIISIYFTFNLASIAIDCYRDKDKKIKPKKKQIKKSVSEETFVSQDETSRNTIAYKENIKNEDWSKDDKPKKEKTFSFDFEEDKGDAEKKDIGLKQVDKTYFDNKKIDLDKKHSGENKNQKEEEKEIEKPQVVEEKIDTIAVEPESEKTEKEPEEEKKVLFDKGFEDVLSSAIEKRKKGTNKITNSENEKPTNDQKIESGKYKIKCSRCGHIFTADIKAKDTKIKCPECGKEGAVK